MKISKTKIDKAGKILAGHVVVSDDDFIEYEEYFDEYRKQHLSPLTETTLEFQTWLNNYGKGYYLAQRLKRKPQIIRKLDRLHVRLTQLQDIGGLRIIVDTNMDVDELYHFIENKIKESKVLSIHKVTDYRAKGRDDTGYRALHLILNVHEYKIELQIRSKIQHYWAEGIERTSVIYGYRLKESEGSFSVLSYFKNLSDVFSEIEVNRVPSSQQKIELDKSREIAEDIIKSDSKISLLSSYVHEGIIKSLVEKEARNKEKFNNWILIFDWNSGCFVNWEVISRKPDEAIKAYVENENQYPAQDGFEVVLIGSSDVSTVKETHSHYFGIERYENILENLDTSIVNISKRMDLDTGAREILLCLVKKKFWNRKVSLRTLKQSYCRNIFTFDDSMETLLNREFLIKSSPHGPVWLNLDKKNEIEACVL